MLQLSGFVVSCHYIQELIQNVTDCFISVHDSIRMHCEAGRLAGAAHSILYYCFFFTRISSGQELTDS
jgi:hypothetical protein